MGQGSASRHRPIDLTRCRWVGVGFASLDPFYGLPAALHKTLHHDFASEQFWNWRAFPQSFLNSPRFFIFTYERWSNLVRIWVIRDSDSEMREVITNFSFQCSTLAPKRCETNCVNCRVSITPFVKEVTENMHFRNAQLRSLGETRCCMLLQHDHGNL